MKNLEKYTKYLKGELSEEELEAVTGDLVKDYYQRAEEKEKLKAMLKQEATQQVSLPTKSRPKAKRMVLKIAAFAASFLLLVSVMNYCLAQIQRSPEQIADKYIEDYHEPNSTRKNLTENLRLQAMQLYENKQYQEAINLWDKVIVKADKDAVVDDYFWRGLNHLKTGNFEDAIQNFELVIKHPSQKMLIEAYWFSSLAHIKLKNLVLAKEQLQLIARNKGEKSVEAQQLLDVFPEE